MDLDTLIITAFVSIDDALVACLGHQRLRQRGPQPLLSDSEVLTMEAVGAFLKLDQDKELFSYFQRHFCHLFPALSRLHRTTFVRQAANLWQVKERMWHHLRHQVDHDPQVSLVDSFPVPVCRFARAGRVRRLREQAAYGYDELAKQTFFGLRAHLHICWPGVIVGLCLAPAHIHDLTGAKELLEQRHGFVLADRNYWSPRQQADWQEQGVRLLAPYKSSKREPAPWPRSLVQKRRRIETVIGQLVGRFCAKTVWARDAWHFFSRWLRNLLSHTLCVLLCQRQGLSPLRFAELLRNC